jgi:hypothetical protein
MLEMVFDRNEGGKKISIFLKSATIWPFDNFGVAFILFRIG